MKNKNQLDILTIALDSLSLEILKRSLRENRVNYHLSCLQEVGDLASFHKKNIHAVFFFSNRQSQKTIDDIRRIHQQVPRAAMTLLSPKPELHGVIGAFRAGLFDYLTIPLESSELRTVIYRLKLHGAIQGGDWSPERAVLQLFSRPESFSSVTDIATGLNQYINLFFIVEKETRFISNTELMKSLSEKLDLSDGQGKKVIRFLSDEIGLIFGLKYFHEKFYFLIKHGEGKISYYVAKKISDYPIKEILSNYLANVLRTSISVLLDAKKREQIRMLSLTDEVTGLYNQRKLIEDLNLFIGRYQHEKMGFSLLFVDIDYFKNVNDQFGHVIGSQLLVDMAKIIKNELRSSDLVYRYGGDEFIVLLPRTPLDEAKKIALRISRSVKDAEFIIENHKEYRLSLSVGMGTFPQDAMDAKAIIDFADKMMYLSKKSGRGKVFHVTEVT